jgi:two-component system, OmpR family, sensor histidine kinase KdpD
MTRLNTGLQPRLDWVDPADVMNSAMVRARVSHPGRSFSAFSEPALKLIHCDAALLEQALFNLLDNAAKFSLPDRPVTISLKPDVATLLFTVEDQGPGIPADQQAHVFDPLFRGSDSSVKGTGLGLAIVRGIAILLGGSVSLESPLHDTGGTRFALSLPFQNGAAT